MVAGAGITPPVPRDGWSLGWGCKFTAQCTPFRHLAFSRHGAGLGWMGQQLAGRSDASTLNLFGYTGVGTLALSQYGPVTHDASKKSVAQARANAALSGMESRPVRWIVDDAAKFTAREVRRGKRYDGIIMDPPKFGRGPDGEVWRLEEHLPGLIRDARQLLDSDSRYLFLTVYAVRMSSLAIAGLLDEVFADLPGYVEHGDLAVREDDAGACCRRRSLRGGVGREVCLRRARAGPFAIPFWGGGRFAKWRWTYRMKPAARMGFGYGAAGFVSDTLASETRRLIHEATLTVTGARG
jgi:hypothetical protein